MVAVRGSRTRYRQVMSLKWFIVVRATPPQCLTALLFYLQRISAFALPASYLFQVQYHDYWVWNNYLVI